MIQAFMQYVGAFTMCVSVVWGTSLYYNRDFGTLPTAILMFAMGIWVLDWGASL